MNIVNETIIIHLTPTKALLLILGPYLFIRVVRSISRSLRHRSLSRQLGCGPVPVEKHRLPWAVDTVWRGLAAAREQQLPELIEGRFVAVSSAAKLASGDCYTFRTHILGGSDILTADPRNVQAILATQFNDFGMGAQRSTNLRVVLGRSIFAVDGAEWHRARKVVRPIFARENVADLDLLGRHFEKMLQVMNVGGRAGARALKRGQWTQPVSLSLLFPLLTIDSATELFLGQSCEALEVALRDQQQQQDDGTGLARKTHHAKDFHWAFERVLKLLGVRLRLRSFYWAYGGRELAECVSILHGFVDTCIDAADAAKKSGEGRGRYDLLESLREQCVDRNDVREQVFGLLAAGRDTTASLLGWVFYCLVREPRVFARLREVILDTFGTGPEAITFENLKSCGYLQHVLSETLRMHSVVPFNSRRALRDTTIPVGGGPDGTQPVFVPAGSEVNFSTHIMHRRKDLWGPDADRFVPERWERPQAGRLAHAHPWSYLPFNGGPRICIGQQFALTEAAYVVVRMLQQFDAIEGLDLDDTNREWHNFTIVCSPGSPLDRNAAVLCRLRVA